MVYVFETWGLTNSWSSLYVTYTDGRCRLAHVARACRPRGVMHANWPPLARRHCQPGFHSSAINRIRPCLRRTSIALVLQGSLQGSLLHSAGNNSRGVSVPSCTLLEFLYLECLLLLIDCGSKEQFDTSA